MRGMRSGGMWGWWGVVRSDEERCKREWIRTGSNTQSRIHFNKANLMSHCIGTVRVVTMLYVFNEGVLSPVLGTHTPGTRLRGCRCRCSGLRLTELLRFHSRKPLLWIHCYVRLLWISLDSSSNIILTMEDNNQCYIYTPTMNALLINL